MKKSVFVLFILFVAFFTAATSQASTVMYGSATAWQTAMGAGNWQFVSEAQIPTGYSELPGNTLTLPSGDSVNFGSTVLYGLQVPTEWATWSGGNTPKVLYTSGAISVTGTFSAPIYAFGVEMQPNDQAPHDMTLTVGDLTGLTLTVDGNGAAAFFGWISTVGVTTMTLSSDTDFAMGRAVAAVPLPGAILLLGSGLIGLIGIRRKIKG